MQVTILATNAIWATATWKHQTFSISQSKSLVITQTKCVAMFFGIFNLM